MINPSGLSSKMFNPSTGQATTATPKASPVSANLGLEAQNALAKPEPLARRQGDGLAGRGETPEKKAPPFASSKGSHAQSKGAYQTTADGSSKEGRSASGTRSEDEEAFKDSLRSASSERRSASKTAAKPTAKSTSKKDAGKTSADAANSSDDVDVERSAMNIFAVKPSSEAQVAQQIEGRGEEMSTSPGELNSALKFMKEMEDEFGVSPQQLVAAMSAAQGPSPQNQISQMAASENGSSQSALASFGAPAKDSFFEKLGLEGPQLKRGEYLYQKMLKEMAQDQMANYLKQNNTEAQVQIIDPQLVQRQEMHRSIDTMSRQFFLNDRRPAYGQVQDQIQNQIQNPNQIPGQKPSQEGDGANGAVEGGMRGAGSRGAGALALPAGFEMVQPQAYSPGQLQAQNPMQNQLQAQNFSDPNGDFEVSDEDGRSATRGASTTGAGDIPLFIPPTVAAQSASQSFDASSNSDSSGAKDQSPNSSRSNLSGSSAKGDTGNLSASDTAVTTGTNRTDTVTQNLVGQQPIDTQTRQFVAPAAAGAEARPSERAEDAMNMRNLVQGAQVLLRRGGGEMKVQMNPEGLGHVDLKVNVNDGKVDIQIMADTADTKHLLEKGMHELKASLTSQRLDVGDVRVDVSKNLDRDVGSNNGQNFDREGARQFMNQFRDDQQAMRQGFFEAPQPRGYRAPKNPSIEPVDDKKPAAKNSKRLNVVV